MINARSRRNLRGVHEVLASVVREADARGAVFTVTEGVRTVARQQELFAAGKSWTLRSRHLTGHAVDIYPHVNGRLVVNDFEACRALSRVFKAIAARRGVLLEWGGDWAVRDGPHYQLAWKQFPSGGIHE